MSSGAEPEAPPVPAGWKAYWDGTHKRHYFHNESTNETTWETPQVDTKAPPAQGGGPAQYAPQERAREQPRQQQRQDRQYHQGHDQAEVSQGTGPGIQGATTTRGTVAGGGTTRTTNRRSEEGRTNNSSNKITTSEETATEGTTGWTDRTTGAGTTTEANRRGPSAGSLVTPTAPVGGATRAETGAMRLHRTWAESYTCPPSAGRRAGTI